MKNDPLFGVFRPKAKHLLPKNVSAIQVIPDGIGRMRLGTILQLPEGAEVEACGEGFDERTMKVSWQGGFYYIFLEDIRSTALERSLSAAG